MGKLVIGCVGLVVGLIVGALLGGALIGGSAAGVGVATGLSAGICGTVEAAQEEGLLDAGEVDLVLSRAAADAAELVGGEAPDAMVGSSGECAAVMERFRATSGS